MKTRGSILCRILCLCSIFFRGVLFFIPCAFFLSASCLFCCAETVYLTNGKKLQGDMRALTQQGLMIEIGGISLDYDLSQISGVDFLEEGETKEGVFEYIEALNLIIADDIRDEDAKEAEVMHLRLNDKPWHGYLVSEEARDLVARHRREMEALKPPSLCGKLRELYIKWMLLREAKHNAFYHLNWDQAESFQAQITEHAAKINEELARIKWLLGDEEVKRIQEFIRQTEQDRRSAEGGIEKDE